MNPRFPLYIPSKGRWESMLTSRALDRMGVDHRIVVEESQLAAYSAVAPRERLLVLDPEYQRRYDTFDSLGDAKSKGPGPARNFIWEHSISEGHQHHWVMDDNIRGFYRLNKNLKIPVGDGTIFAVMEEFALRYENVAMSGPNYCMFAPRKVAVPPFVVNTRIYSCNLIRNDVPFRWRGRYNEDTDLSLRMLKAGWCTIQFNAFLQEKVPTQTIKGGCDEDFYKREGTLPKSHILTKMHPDVARITMRFGRVHHHVNYKPFKANKLKLRADVSVEPGVNNYGMELKQVDVGWKVARDKARARESAASPDGGAK